MKKTIKLIIGILLLAAIVAAGAYFFLSQKPVSEKPAPVPSETTVVEIPETAQFAEGSVALGNFFTNGDLGKMNPEYLSVAAWTVDKYINEAVMNSYFATGYWATKDSYAPSSIESYISPYLSDSLNEQYIAESGVLKENASSEFFRGKLAFPNPDLAISSECYETWQEELCFSQKSEILNMEYTGLSKNSVQIIVQVRTYPLYQKPNSPEGNLVSQTTDYNLTFVLEKNSNPSSKDTEIPIMIISNVSSSLDIKEETDYLVNGSTNN